MSEEEIIDIPERANHEKPRLKSRTPSDLMIILGIAHFLVGIYAIYIFFEILLPAFRMNIQLNGTTSLLRFIVRQSLPLFFGLTLIIGGFGLIRHKMIGWKFALASSIFAISLPVLKMLLNMYLPGIKWLVSSLFATLFLLCFGLSLAFLISNVVRDFYQPKTKDYLMVGIIVGILSLNFVLTPLLF